LWRGRGGEAGILDPNQTEPKTIPRRNLARPKQARTGVADTAYYAHPHAHLQLPRLGQAGPAPVRCSGSQLCLCALLHLAPLLPAPPLTRPSPSTEHHRSHLRRPTRLLDLSPAPTVSSIYVQPPTHQLADLSESPGEQHRACRLIAEPSLAITAFPTARPSSLSDSSRPPLIPAGDVPCAASPPPGSRAF